MKLEGEARELGIGPTTLVRMWILERFRRHPGAPQDVFGAIDLFLQRAFREGIMLQTARDERAEGGALRAGILLQTPRDRTGASERAGSYPVRQYGYRLAERAFRSRLEQGGCTWQKSDKDGLYHVHQ